MEILLAIGLCVLSYFLGCFSSARVLARSIKKLNIHKVGTGLADTENIYLHISKPLGVAAAFVDTGKMVLYLLLLRCLFSHFELVGIGTNTMMFVYGFFMILGHCLPVTHKFKGSRGMFTYIGLLIVSAFIPVQMLITLLIAGVLVVFFKQIRFAQYFIVLFPPFLSFFWGPGRPILTLMVITAIMMGVLNFVVSKRLGEL